MNDLIKRLCRPGYDLQKEQAIQEAIIEIRELRAKIEEMEKQQPVAEIGQQYTLLFVGSGSMTELVKRHGIKVGDKLYALPGVKGE